MRPKEPIPAIKHARSMRLSSKRMDSLPSEILQRVVRSQWLIQIPEKRGFENAQLLSE